MTIYSSLPDVARHQLSSTPLAIDQVGMRNIVIPVVVAGHRIQAQVAVAVNLPDPGAKGIHMSRLYNLLQTHLVHTELTPERAQQMLGEVIASHRDVGSTSASMTLAFDLLLERPALSSDLSGWKRYRAEFAVQRNHMAGTEQNRLSLTIDYSSTCPCSAALSRQVLQEAFLEDWQNRPLELDTIAEWLLEKGSIATPHSQRSQIRISLPITGDSIPAEALIDQVEAVLGTPVQTAVKRIDEQAFARRNGANLMYVEDAVRRVYSALAEDCPNLSVEVIHRESLHQHDATARISAPLANPESV